MLISGRKRGKIHRENWWTVSVVHVTNVSQRRSTPPTAAIDIEMRNTENAHRIPNSALINCWKGFAENGVTVCYVLRILGQAGRGGLKNMESA